MLIVGDLRFMGYVVALAEHGHFAKAARTLGITQPALSQGIKRLEIELEARLFDRAGGQVTLTPYGEATLRHAKGLLQDSEELHRELMLLKELKTGSLAVIAGTYPAEISGNRAMGRIAQKYPGIQCRIESLEWHSCTEVLLKRKADLAVAEVTIADAEPQLVAEVINTQIGTFFCRPGHPILRLKDPTVRDVSGYPWAGVPFPPRIVRCLGELLPAAGRIDELRRFIPAIRVENFSGAKQVIQECDAIGAAPIALIHNELHQQTLVPIPCHAPGLHLNYGFIYLRDRMLSPAARAFMAEVRAIEEEFMPKAASPRRNRVRQSA